MTSADRSLLHASILQSLREIGNHGRPTQLLLVDARMAGFELSLPELERELRQLADENLIASFTPALGAPRYRITGLGESKLVEAGL